MDRRGMESKRDQAPGALLSRNQGGQEAVGIGIGALVEFLRRCRAGLAPCIKEVEGVFHVLAFATDKCIESPPLG